MNSSIDISMALDYRMACGRLGLTLIPVRGHEKMLSSVPYTAIEDLALIYKVEIGPADSIIIDHEMLDGYGICFDGYIIRVKAKLLSTVNHVTKV